MARPKHPVCSRRRRRKLPQRSQASCMRRAKKPRSSKMMSLSMLSPDDMTGFSMFANSLTSAPKLVEEGQSALYVPEAMSELSSQQDRFDSLIKERKLHVQYLQQLKQVNKRNTGFSVAWPQDHFSMVVVARRYSGKSTLIDKLVKEHLVSKRMDWNTRRLVHSDIQFFERKILFSPTAHRDTSLEADSFDEVYTRQEDLEVFIARYKNADEGAQFPSTLIVMDDVSTWLDSQSHSLLHWFITVNRHYQCSIITVAHNLKNAAPSIRNNASEWILFRCKLDEEKKKIGEAFGTSFDIFYDQVDWSIDYNFLYMTLRKGPVTWFFEGRTKELENKVTQKSMTFNDQDVTVRMRYLGMDTLPSDSTLRDVCPV